MPRLTITPYMATQGRNRRLQMKLSQRVLSNRMRISFRDVKALEIAGTKHPEERIMRWAHELETTVSRLQHGPEFRTVEMTNTRRLLPAALRQTNIRPAFISYRKAGLLDIIRRWLNRKDN